MAALTAACSPASGAWSFTKHEYAGRRPVVLPSGPPPPRGKAMSRIALLPRIAIGLFAVWSIVGCNHPAAKIGEGGSPGTGGNTGSGGSGPGSGGSGPGAGGATGSGGGSGSGGSGAPAADMIDNLDDNDGRIIMSGGRQ